MFNHRNKQQGFLLIVAAAIIVIFAFLAVAISHMMIGNAMSAADALAATQSFYIAESGIERSALALLDPNLAQRDNCVNLANANSVLANGEYQLTGAISFPANLTTLTTSITAAATIIPVSSVAGFDSSGRVVIESEAIDYQRVSGNNLMGLVRGVDNTTAVAHPIGGRVSQYQCRVNANGFVPNAAALTHKQRQINTGTQIQEVWAVGNVGRFIQWNYPIENNWNNSAGGSNQNINAVSMLNYADGWAVGNNQGNNLTIRRWDPVTATWIASAFALNVDLDGVSTISHNEAWAVGQTADNRQTILRWNGSVWCRIAAFPTFNCGGKTIQSGVPINQNDLLAVHVIDTDGNGLGDFGIAGGGMFNTGRMLIYNGTTWSDSAIPAGVGQIHGVFVLSAADAWAVGQASTGISGRILHWNGANWSIVTNTSQQMNAIYMLNANDGWAVGNNGIAYHWNGTAWSANNPGGNSLYGISMLASDDVWAVGQGGRRMHWDGTAWSTNASGGQQLNAVATVGANQKPLSAWR